MLLTPKYEGTFMGIPTKIDVRVMAVGGKFLGDDIGGALVTITDARTGEFLAEGNTRGDSGESQLMDVCINRSNVWPVDGASVYTAVLDLDKPRLLKISAYGPLAAPQAANTATACQWVYPGKDITGGKEGGGLFLEIHGLAVQALNPPAHFMPKCAPTYVDIRANVTMMCGCPIGESTAWDPKEFEVVAKIEKVGGDIYEETIQLAFDKKAPMDAPSQFTAQWLVPVNNTKELEIYQITINAFQERTGNTGIDFTTILIPQKI